MSQKGKSATLRCSHPKVTDEKEKIFEATYEKPSDSPDGGYRLVVLRGHDGEARYKTFQILEHKNARQKKLTEENYELYIYSDWLTVYTSTIRIPARFRSDFLWDDKNRVWAYDSDAGNYFYWQRDSEGNWKKNIYLDKPPEKRPPLPPLLQRNYDELHNKSK